MRPSFLNKTKNCVYNYLKSRISGKNLQEVRVSYEDQSYKWGALKVVFMVFDYDIYDKKLQNCIILDQYHFLA